MHIADDINRNVAQAGICQERSDLRPTRSFSAGRRGYRGERSLALQRQLVRALDVRACRADAIVGEKCVDHGGKL